MDPPARKGLGPAGSATRTLFGTVLNEQSPSMNDARLESMSEDEMKKRAAARYGDKVGTVVDAYRKAYPSVKPVELLSRMFSVADAAVGRAAPRVPLLRDPVRVLQHGRFRFRHRWRR